MKLSRILNEHTIKPYYKNLLKTMSSRSIGEEVGEIWDFLTNVLSIEDMEVKTEIIHLYKKLNNYEEGDFDNLSDSDLSDIESLDDMDEKRVALAKNLDVSPLLIEEYNQWGSHYQIPINVVQSSHIIYIIFIIIHHSIFYLIIIANRICITIF